MTEIRKIRKRAGFQFCGFVVDGGVTDGRSAKTQII